MSSGGPARCTAPAANGNRATDWDHSKKSPVALFATVGGEGFSNSRTAPPGGRAPSSGAGVTSASSVSVAPAGMRAAYVTTTRSPRETDVLSAVAEKRKKRKRKIS